MGRTHRIVELMGRLAPVEGYNLSALNDVRFLRSNQPLHRVPVLYDPGIVIVCQGSKRGYLGDEIYRYDAQHYLVVSVPVPFTMETEASKEAPMLAVYLRLDFTLAAELMVALEDFPDLVEAKPRGMYSSPMDDRLSESLLRFLEVMSVPMDAQILGPTLMREIYYRIITGEQGGSMRAALNRQGQFGKVARAIRKIHGCYRQRLDLGCRDAGRGGDDERAEFSCALSQRHQHLAHAIPQVHAPASGTLVDVTQRHNCRHGLRPGGL